MTNALVARASDTRCHSNPHGEERQRQDGNRESGGAQARPGGGMVGPRTDSKVLTTCT